ncbi:MAG: general secretion pathway protein GspB [Thermoguttaceae bacterium]|nr:general secretion pathway protein GspB [Thermoguttaceae bacterium]MDW8038339.1 hypothetical protein [Thermoguttaceae bacterium]
MDLNRFIAQLRREIKAHPGKAALLAGLLLVALYYWIPLIGRWIGRSKELQMARAQATIGENLRSAGEKSFPGSSGPGPNLALESSALRGPETPGLGKTAQDMPSWDQLVRWREADPHTQPVRWSSDRQDPFQPLAPGTFSENKDYSADTLAAQNTGKIPSSSLSHSQIIQEPPEKLDLELTSIVVGPNRRLALINGQPYQEGDVLVVSKNGHQWQFRLSRIRPTSIQLQWNDRQYELSLPQTPSNVLIQVVSTTKQENP